MAQSPECRLPSSASGIPRVVHQSWPSARLPQMLQPLSMRWRALPRYEVRLWTDEQNAELWAHHLPELLDVFAGYNATPGEQGVTRPAGIRRADASRLLYMFIFGGIYSDMDVVPCGEDVSELLSEQLVLVREPASRKSAAAKRYLSNFFMASVPKHPFWRHALDLLRARAHHANVMSVAGPYFLNAAWISFSQRCTGLSGAARVLTYSELQSKVAVHFWAGTWHARKLSDRLANGSATVVFDKGMQAWLGVNHSHNCPAAAASTHFVETTWACYNRKWPCARPTWARFDRECGGRNAGCGHGTMVADTHKFVSSAALPPSPKLHPRCYATLLFRPRNQSVMLRKQWALDEAMVSLWAARMANTTLLPIYVMHDERTERLASELARRAGNGSRRMVVPQRISTIVVDARGTFAQYREMYSKIHAWNLPCERVLYTDYDGWPLRSMDEAFELCGRHTPLCAVPDTVTPIAAALRKRGGYFNGGVLLIQARHDTYHALLQEAARDSQRGSARWFAEQGMLNNFFSNNWTRLPPAFNVQGVALHGRVDEASARFVHEKFFKLRRGMLKRLGVPSVRALP